MSPSKSTAYPWVTSQQSLSTSRVASTPRHSNSQTGDMCTTDGFMGDTENCRKFYRCVGNQRGGFIRYEFSCSESTIWDDDSQSCNHPWAVQRRRCGRGGTQTDNSSGSNNQTQNKIPLDSTIQQQIQLSYGEKVSQSQTQISHGSVIQNQTQINYGEKQNKKTSIAKQNQTQISSGSAVSQTQTQINHGNTGVQTQLQIDHSNKSSQTQTQVYESSSKSTTTTEVQDDESDQGFGSTQSNKEHSNNNEESSNECTESGFMGDKNNCKKFYRCVDNGKGSYTKYDFSCGEGTVWDPNLEACNHAWAVKECGGKVPTNSSTTSTTTQNYYPTSASTISEEELPSYGNQNQERPTTLKPTTIQENPVSTSPSSSGETVCSSSGFIGDENDCKKFYRCVDNGGGNYTKYEYKCGEGTVWDPDIETCNHVWAVKKCGGSSTDINKVETTTKTETTVMTTVSLIQTTTQTSNQNIDYYDSGYNNQNQPNESPITTTTKEPHNSPPGSGHNCQSNGFMGDKYDCKKFYRCVDDGNGGYIRYEFSCGEGTVWDPKIEACNHAWAVEKCGEDDSADVHKETTPKPDSTVNDEYGSSDSHTTEKEDQGYDQSYRPTEKTTTSTSQGTPVPSSDICTQEGFSGDRKNCKKFYRCVSDQRGGFIKYDFTCGEGTVWDSEINSCNHERDVKSPCNTSTSTQNESTTENSQVPEKTTSSTFSETTTVQSFIPSSSTQQPTSNKQCAQEGFVGDDQDCKKFYRCVDDGKGGFIKYEFSCGEGTVWDPEIQTCNHPTPDRKCGGTGQGTISTTREPDRESDEMYTDSNTSYSTEPSPTTSLSQKPQWSTDTCTSEGFYGDSNNCKKFYRCVDNGKGSYTKYDFTCGDGTIWVQDIQACDHDNGNNDCSKNTEYGSTQTSHTTQAAMTVGYTTTLSTNTDVEQQQSPHTTQASSSSNNKCTTEGFYANPDDCQKFYRCVNNGNGGYTKYDFSCGDGTIWVQEIQACDHDNGIESCSKQSGSSTTVVQWSDEHQTLSESSTATVVLSSPYEPDKGNDEYPSETSTKPSSGEEKCTSEGFYPNKKDCKRFYRCVDNGKGGFTKYDFACGEGTAWDPNIQSCNHITEVQNCQGYQEESQSQPVMQDEDTQPAGDSTSTSTTEKTSTSEPDSGSIKPSNKDTCEKEGYFGNSEDCKKFYRCVDNGKGGLTKYDYTCGEGTIWDQDITTCNHPQDVTNPSCQQTVSNSSSSGESSSSSSSSTTQSSSATNSGQDGLSNCSQENSSNKPANKEVNCTEAGYFADPNDCKKFYRCVDWDGNGKRFSVYHFDCGEGTIWDPALDTCNHEDSVYPPRDCSGAQSQNENVNQQSSTTEKSTTKDSTTVQESTSTQQTTQESSNDKETTTEQSLTTNEGTKAPESTTNEQTTTEQTTTSEQTTQQTTSEQTTSQQTTVQQTTSEQTTAQQTTEQQSTSEETTTQQAATEQTTTQQTTTQLTTSSEQSTTQQSTTEQTTSQQTASEHTTTQESTTSEQTTTQQTTEETITQQTTEQTTTQNSISTEQTTNSEDNDQQSTTQSTDETTTQESTTAQTTEQSSETTEDSSTTSQTDDSSTTEGGDETTESSSSNGDCPETENDQNVFVCPSSFRRHPKYCNLFYQCTEDDDSHDVKIAMFNCPNNTIYDETQTKCVEKDKAEKKCDGEIAQRRRLKRLDVTYKEPVS